MDITRDWGRWAVPGGALGSQPLDSEELIAHEAIRIGFIAVYHAEDLPAISQDAGFYHSQVAWEVCRPIMLKHFSEERERFELRLTQHGNKFSIDEVGMDIESFESSYVCFLAPLLSSAATVEGARRYCAERAFVPPWFLVNHHDIHRV
ncbi:hypothetical protein [Salinicola avicenniae]|uniref:hypothetical protein n=1 Tax=Salinicola avicenniae TaxID=2916836 RepID=UPI0020745C1F|nr:MULTISPECIES: hypothetical protein [unclassified Salinicola]